MMLKQLVSVFISALVIPSTLNAEEYLCTPKFNKGTETKILFRRITGFSYLKDFYKDTIDNLNLPEPLLVKRDYFRREDWSKSLEGNPIKINEIDLRIIKEDPYDLVLGQWVDNQEDEGYQLTVIDKYGDFRWKRGKLPFEYEHILFFTGTIPNPKDYEENLQFSQQKGYCKLKDKYSERDLSLSFQINNLKGGL